MLTGRREAGGGGESPPTRPSHIGKRAPWWQPRLQEQARGLLRDRIVPLGLGQSKDHRELLPQVCRPALLVTENLPPVSISFMPRAVARQVTCGPREPLNN